MGIKGKGNAKTMELVYILLVAFVVGFFILIFLYISQRKKVLTLKAYLEELEFKNKSISVKHGQRWEQFAPFMEEFQKVAQRENFVFIGNPIDGLAFDDDAVKFIEVKTGTSQLSKKQHHIKELIRKKKVEWHELRF